MAKYLGIIQPFGVAPLGDIAIFEAKTPEEAYEIAEKEEMKCILKLEKHHIDYLKEKLKEVA